MSGESLCCLSRGNAGRLSGSLCCQARSSQGTGTHIQPQHPLRAAPGGALSMPGKILGALPKLSPT